MATSPVEDAKLANTSECTLILTKGDIDTYFLTLGQDKYRVYPLEGELLNVREASPQELEKNTDIQNIKKLLGLQDGKIYNNVNELRYGHLMIMTDEDHDGTRIKGLLLNFLHYFWPSLLKLKNFMQWFVLPIVKVSDKRTNKVFLFYTKSAYAAWKEELGNQFSITSYMELETIGSERGEYNSDHHVKDFVWEDDEDGDAIERAFSKMKIEERKDWLQEQDGAHLDLKEKGIRYRDFMNKEFKNYAMADLQGSIPSMVDGLKPRERKILFYALKMPIIREIEVDHFNSYVLEHSSNHNGEASLVSTIIGMAQNYVGSNNINLLQLNRHTQPLGGKDPASGGLLFTQLSLITRYIFHKNDELLLNYLNEDGQSIEPEWFIPIIPMVLVNGSEARGAWSSFIPKYNPRDIIANLNRLLSGEEMVDMLPWHKGFSGEIQKRASNEYTTKDIMLVYGNPTQAYTADQVRNDDTNMHVEITMNDKLTDTLSTDNMYVFDSKGKLKKYNTPEELLEDFYHLRLDFYKNRKTSLLRELKILKNKERFTREVWDGKLVLSKKLKFEKCVELKDKGFESLQSIERKAREETQEEEDVGVKGYDGYDYLFSLPSESFDLEYIEEEMEKEMKTKDKELEHLTTTTPESLWLTDLAALDKQLALEKYPEAKYTEAEKKARAKRAGDAAGQSTNKKRCMR